MLSTTFALMLAATAPALAADTPVQKNGFGPITAIHRVGHNKFCVRSGWNTASVETNRRVHAGECRTAADWRTIGLAFDPPAVQQARRQSITTHEQVAAR